VFLEDFKTARDRRVGGRIPLLPLPLPAEEIALYDFAESRWQCLGECEERGDDIIKLNNILHGDNEKDHVFPDYW
jgi:hypothetical protein